MADTPQFRSTTIVTVRRDGHAAMAGDGQVSLGQTVMKSHARKVRRIAGGRVVAGFAGASADASAGASAETSAGTGAVLATVPAPALALAPVPS